MHDSRKSNVEFIMIDNQLKNEFMEFIELFAQILCHCNY